MGRKEGRERTLERVQKDKQGGRETAGGREGEHGCAPSPEESQAGRDAGSLGEGQPHSTHSVGGREDRAQAAFYTGGRARELGGGWAQSPEVLP